MGRHMGFRWKDFESWKSAVENLLLESYEIVSDHTSLH